MSEIVSIKGASNSNKEIIVQIFKELYQPLCYYVYGMIKNKEDSQDVVLDIFCKLIEGKRNFEDHSHLRSYLFIAAKNASISYLRKLQIRNRHKAGDLDNYLEHPEKIERLKDETEIVAEIYNEIKKLPERVKEVFVLTHLEGHSRAEVARKLSISENTVRNHNARAMELLRSSLGDKKLLLALTLIKCIPVKDFII